MKIRLDRLYEGEHRLAHRIEPGDLELDSSYFFDPIDIVIHWDRRDPNIRLRFDIFTQRQSQCDRCLDDVTLAIETQAELLVQLREEVPKDMEDSDYKVVSPSEVEIDFTVDVRDAILLAVPLKILCDEDCKGLCSHCGANLNDGPCDCQSETKNPQWEALQKLKNNR